MNDPEQTRRRIQEVVEGQMAVHTDLAQLRDDYDRMRHNRDIAQQRADHYHEENTHLKAERDHYMVQANELATRLRTVTEWFRSQADVVEQMTQEAIRAPYSNRNGRLGPPVEDDGDAPPSFLTAPTH